MTGSILLWAICPVKAIFAIEECEQSAVLSTTNFSVRKIAIEIPRARRCPVDKVPISVGQIVVVNARGDVMSLDAVLHDRHKIAGDDSGLGVDVHVLSNRVRYLTGTRCRCPAS